MSAKSAFGRTTKILRPSLGDATHLMIGKRRKLEKSYKDLLHWSISTAPPGCFVALPRQPKHSSQVCTLVGRSHIKKEFAVKQWLASVTASIPISQKVARLNLDLIPSKDLKTRFQFQSPNQFQKKTFWQTISNMLSPRCLVNTGWDTKIRNLLFGLFWLNKFRIFIYSILNISGTWSNQNKPNKRFRILVSHPVSMIVNQIRFQCRFQNRNFSITGRLKPLKRNLQSSHCGCQKNLYENQFWKLIIAKQTC